jgi:hypothetical protein
MWNTPRREMLLQSGLNATPSVLVQGSFAGKDCPKTAAERNPRPTKALPNKG